MLHDVADTKGARDHVMAVVPVPASDLYLVLEQDEDVALLCPSIFGVTCFSSAALGLW